MHFKWILIIVVLMCSPWCVKLNVSVIEDVRLGVFVFISLFFFFFSVSGFVKVVTCFPEQLLLRCVHSLFKH